LVEVKEAGGVGVVVVVVVVVVVDMVVGPPVEMEGPSLSLWREVQPHLRIMKSILLHFTVKSSW
jgi:hypothetical protein